MDGLDDPENTAKVSDSAYGTSCSNSQSRRSHSSKSTHSSSHSSGSSGYIGEPAASATSQTLGESLKKCSKKKNRKKKSCTSDMEFHMEATSETEARPQELDQKNEANQQPVKENDADAPPAPTPLPEPAVEEMDVASSDTSNGGMEAVAAPGVPSINGQTSQGNLQQLMRFYQDGFSCVISMHDGVVQCTTSTITGTLGFSKDMWVGRPFIEFIHPKDRNIFSSQIMKDVTGPNMISGEKCTPNGFMHTICCRLRTYRCLRTSFDVKSSTASFLPFALKLTFKDFTDDEGKAAYLVIQTTRLKSAYKIPLEVALRPTVFTTRHIGSGQLQFLDVAGVPYLGYLPQDVCGQDLLALCHPEDMSELVRVHEALVQSGSDAKSQAYRMLAQNGNYVKLESAFSSFINPWSKKLEFVTGKHSVVEGPGEPDVFLPPRGAPAVGSAELTAEARAHQERIVQLMGQMTSKTSEAAKMATNRRCLELASLMESLSQAKTRPGPTEDLQVEIQDQDKDERDSVMLGGISPHHENEYKPSAETPLSYYILNYNETLQRYFDSYMIKNDDSVESTDLCQSINALESPPSCEEKEEASAIDMETLQQRLTEVVLIKHNCEIQKELIRKQREHRRAESVREQSILESRRKKRKHLARCNAPYQPVDAAQLTAAQLTAAQFAAQTALSAMVSPTVAAAAQTALSAMPHGVKRPAWQCGLDESASKHLCTSKERALRPDASAPLVTQLKQSYVTSTTTVAAGWAMPASVLAPMLATPLAAPLVTPLATSLAAPLATPVVTSLATSPATPLATSLATPLVQPVPMVNPMASAPSAVPGMIYYAVPNTPALPISSYQNVTTMSTYHQAGTVPYLMYGQGVLGAPFVYSRVAAPAAPAAPPAPPAPAAPTAPAAPPTGHHPLPLALSNYEEACKPIPERANPSSSSKQKGVGATAAARLLGESRDNNSETIQAAAPAPAERIYKVPKVTKVFQAARDVLDKNDESNPGEKTDGDSSFSSFCTSFFKTDSGSNTESETKNKDADKVYCSVLSHAIWEDKGWSNEATAEIPLVDFVSYREVTNVVKRKVPCSGQVEMTPELQFQYQMPHQNLEEVLVKDRAWLANTEQPPLVNEQLSQLYLELKLNGLPERLSLGESCTSSGSSGEETGDATSQLGPPTKAARRNRDYSRLGMIYEEDAPLPPPPFTPPQVPVPSTSCASASGSK